MRRGKSATKSPSVVIAIVTVVQVKADLSVADNGHRRAETSIRLQEGETVTANILLPKTVTY